MYVLGRATSCDSCRRIDRHLLDQGWIKCDAICSTTEIAVGPIQDFLNSRKCTVPHSVTVPTKYPAGDARRGPFATSTLNISLLFYSVSTQSLVYL